ncbi:MAG TPA: VOC family protein [Candidatus Acidoferrum sp.]|nr:VOC family protein [Candidatus Acidoferrum sp.]
MDHTLVHFEIPAQDVEKLKQFYEQVFNWKITLYPSPLDYWLIQTVPVDENGVPQRPGVNGGMFKKQEAGIKPINYFAVESINDFLAKIEKLGGKVISPKQEVPNVGWIAAAEDPEGNQFALIQSLRI